MPGLVDSQMDLRLGSFINSSPTALADSSAASDTYDGTSFVSLDSIDWRHVTSTKKIFFMSRDVNTVS